VSTERSTVLLRGGIPDRSCEIGTTLHTFVTIIEMSWVWTPFDFVDDFC